MTEVVISKKRILVGLLLLILLVGVIFALPFARRFLAGHEATSYASNPTTLTPTPNEDLLAQAAALAGANAFYTVDYREQQAWLDRLCAVSTQIGCTVDQTVLAASLWDGFETNQTATTVQVSIQDKVLDQTLPTRGGAQAQIWRMQIELSAPWPQQTQPITQFEALALVIQEQDGWKFERFLMEEEASTYEKGEQP